MSENLDLLLTSIPFQLFLKKHGIDPNVYKVDSNEIPRCFRLNGCTTEALQIEEIQKTFEKNIHEINWCPGFYSVSSDVKLVDMPQYLKGQIYGMDVSSGYSVSVLDPRPGEHILDLCCAPGAKLSLMADLMEKRGSITGVDISLKRLQLCRKLFYKYNILPSPEKTDWFCRLIKADGTTFSLGWKQEIINCSHCDIVLDSEELMRMDPKLLLNPRRNKSFRARMKKRKRERLQEENCQACHSTIGLYDKVMVDAECTHDGSLKHILKSLNSSESWDQYIEKYLNPDHVNDILKLQASLIRNGFRLLKTGGTLVYSTCSLSLLQNEEIVKSFLRVTPNAQLIPLEILNLPAEKGKIDGTLRFTPLRGTSGLFIAKIIKLNLNDESTSS